VLNYIGCSTSGRQDTYSSHAVSSLQPAIKPYLFIYFCNNFCSAVSLHYI